MSSNPLPSSILALGFLSLVACSSAPAASGIGRKDGSSTLAATPRTDACPASLAWLTSSTLPTEVPGDKTACNFEQFMWQSLLALVQPTADPAILQFESW